MLKSIDARQSRELFRGDIPVKNRIAVDSKMCQNCDTQVDQQDGLPKYSSPLTMIQKVGGVDRKIRVVLKVYSTMYGMYAVVSQDRVIVKDCGYINLKNCTVLTNEKDLSVQIIQRNCEGLTLSFKVTDSEEHKKLLKVLQPDEKHSRDEENEENCLLMDKEGNVINKDHSKENYHHHHSSATESKLNKMWKRDLSPRSPCGSRKGSLPALDESEENDSSESEHEDI